MRITITDKECENYPKTYTTIISKLNLLINNNETPNLRLGDYLDKYKNELTGLEIEFVNSAAIKENLGYSETANFYRNYLKIAEFNEISSSINNLKAAEKEIGDTMYDKLIKVFEKRNIKIILN